MITDPDDQARNQSMMLWCFSPAVMLGTFLIEYTLAVIAFVHYRQTLVGRLAIGILLLLGTFQLAEYAVCTNRPSLMWAKIGIVAITLLPPLGLHLISIFTKRSAGLGLAYGLALGFSGMFLFLPQVSSGATCTGNYVILHLDPGVGVLYGIYYLGVLLWAILAAYLHRPAVLLSGPRAALAWLIWGYLAFILPSGIVYLLSDRARDAIPSIMCGFALILAIILVGRVLPLSHDNHRQKA